MPAAFKSTVLVTGAARRLGRAIAFDLAKSGHNVAVHAHRSHDEAKALVDAIVQGGGHAAFFQADLTDPAQTDGLLKDVADRLGPVDLLVNNASIFMDDSAEAFDAARFEAHFAIHLKAPLILGAAMLRQLPKNQNGLIVNMIDQRVFALNPRFFSYTLSKSALWTATQTMAQAFAPRIRVNAIGPGPSMKSERQAQEDFDRQIDGLILKRGPGLDEFGRTIRFLFDTPSITGQMIALDGGQHLAWETPDVTGIPE
ncbi:SDR family oxidoreductase [Martelella alba]|uniref:SDR family oxidoreductase n=1 Tax=Martelella alba TaxID=2590451 RepID=A0A506UB44_9HYPH|nr:SDR family oxidoreductase [Martelella alba]TPW29829.1 SDR family oxidoreductase [Martelella alba]